MMKKRSFVFSIGLIILLLTVSFLIPASMRSKNFESTLLFNTPFQSALFVFRIICVIGLALLLAAHKIIQRFFGWMFMLLIALASIFLFCEIFARAVITPAYSWDSLFPVDQTRKTYPYIQFKGEPGSMNLNELGYPGPSPATEPDSGEFRIFVLGGSTVFNGDPPFTGYMESYLHEAGWETSRVYNFGVVSSSSPMAMARVLYEVVDYNPDLVIFYNGGNDMDNPLYADPRPGYPFNFIAYEDNLILKNIEDYPGFLLLAYKSYLLRLIFQDKFANTFGNLEELRSKTGHLSTEWEQSIAREYLSSLQKTNEMGTAFGFDFMAFLQPMVHYKKILDSKEKVFLSDYAPFHEDMRQLILDGADSLYPEPMIINATELFGNDSSRHFTDDIHITQESKKIVAQYLVDQILEHWESSLPY